MCLYWTAAVVVCWFTSIALFDHISHSITLPFNTYYTGFYSWFKGKEKERFWIRVGDECLWAQVVMLPVGITWHCQNVPKTISWNYEKFVSKLWCEVGGRKSWTMAVFPATQRRRRCTYTLQTIKHYIKPVLSLEYKSIVRASIKKIHNSIIMRDD